MTDGKWIEFLNERKSDSGKTLIWDVVIAQGGNEGIQLGEVKWYGAWRQYAFFPFQGTLYEEDCLHDIAAFLEKQTEGRRK